MKFVCFLPSRVALASALASACASALLSGCASALLSGYASVSPTRKIASVSGAMQVREAALHFQNEEAFKAKLKVVRQAQESLDLVYYIVESDPSSALLLQEVLKAAEERQVTVRVLVDYFQSQKELPLLKFLASQPNVEVRRWGAPTNEFAAAMIALGIDPQAFIPAATALNTTELGALLVQTPAFQDIPALKAVLARPAAERKVTEIYQTIQTYALTHPEILPFAKGFADFLYWNHFKLVLADRSCFVMGGRNLSDQYHARQGHALVEARSYAFQDLDLSGCETPGTSTQGASFESLWSSGEATPLDLKIFEREPRAPLTAADLQARAKQALGLEASQPTHPSLRWDDKVLAQLVTNIPPVRREGNASIAAHYTEALNKVPSGERVDLVNAYFFLNDKWGPLEGGGPSHTQALDELRGAVLRAARRGVEVRVYTNSFESTDLNTVNLAAFSTYRALTTAKVKIFELEAGQGSLHVKAAALGPRLLAVGSFNLDPRSHLYDTNNVLFVQDLRSQGVKALQQFVETLRWRQVDADRLTEIDRVLESPEAQERFKQLKFLKALI